MPLGELVNPAFCIPDDDDITSGGCSTCALGPLTDPNGVPVYTREFFGESFTRITAREWADLSTQWYTCGVDIP